MSEGYKDFREHYEDYREIIDIYLEEYMSYIKKTVRTETPMDKYRGIAVSYEQAADFRRKLPFILSAEGEERVCSVKNRINEKKERNSVFLPLEYAGSCFGLDDREKLVLASCFFAASDSGIADCFAYINNDVSKKYPTLGTAANMFYYGNITIPALNLSRVYRYIYDIEKDMPVPYLTELKPARRIFEFLSGDLIIRDTDCCKAYGFAGGDEPIYGRKDELNKIASVIGREKSFDILLYGEEGSGRRFTAVNACRAAKRNMLCLDWRETESDGLCRLQNDTARELYLQKSVLCICGITDETDTNRLFSFVNGLRMLSPCIIYCALTPIAMGSMPCIRIKMDEPDYDSKLAMWNSGKIKLSAGTDLNGLAGKYRFSFGTIRSLLSICENMCGTSGADEITEEMIETAALELSQGALCGKAYRVETNFRMDDLILPQSEKNQLAEAMNHIRFKHRVYDLWDFKSKMAYGKGLSVLFEGPPGTGKTMAASIVGNELGLPVFKADLSKMMSKYIGETEKSLGEVFDAAEKSNAVLFFDETDAIFGKRSEIKDSHDKYANIETSYLLQKMEEYDGIVIMTTNLLRNIDDAFLRRISYIIRFPFPENEQRRMLWQTAFPAKAQLEGADIDFLAGSFEMTGAMIKNAALSAAFLAAAKNKPISMEEILKSVVKQFSKFGKTIGRQDLGPYAYLELL